jgi:hypothetical protein
MLVEAVYASGGGSMLVEAVGCNVGRLSKAGWKRPQQAGALITAAVLRDLRRRCRPYRPWLPADCLQPSYRPWWRCRPK